MPRGSTEIRRKLFYYQMNATRPDPADPAKKKKVIDPHFAGVTYEMKGTERHKVAGLDETRLSGNFLRIGHKEAEFKDATGKPRKDMKLIISLHDGEEEYKIEASLKSSLGRNLCNMMLAIDPTIKKVEYISMSVSKYKKKDTGEYEASLWIRVNHIEDPLKWMYSWKEHLAQYIDVVPDHESSEEGATKKIYKRLDQFMLNEWMNLEKRLNAAAPAEPAAVPSPNAGNAPPPPTGDDEPFGEGDGGGDDLPF